MDHPRRPERLCRSDPAVANGVLFHGSSGVLTARNAATGTFLYSDSPTPGRPLSPITSVVVANGAVYAAREAIASPGYEPGLTAHHP